MFGKLHFESGDARAQQSPAQGVIARSGRVSEQKLVENRAKSDKDKDKKTLGAAVMYLAGGIFPDTNQQFFYSRLHAVTAKFNQGSPNLQSESA